MLKNTILVSASLFVLPLFFMGVNAVFAAKDIDPIIAEPCVIVVLPNGQQGCKPN